MKSSCPCCGAPMAAPPSAEALATLRLGRSERELLGYYVETYPRALHTERVVSRLWQLDPNGGPGDPRNGICQRVFRINRALKPLGWCVQRIGMEARQLTRLDA
jgi:hypothetical protein